jgi:hypothetical protein
MMKPKSQKFRQAAMQIFSFGPRQNACLLGKQTAGQCRHLLGFFGRRHEKGS